MQNYVFLTSHYVKGHQGHILNHNTPAFASVSISPISASIVNEILPHWDMARNILIFTVK